MDELPLRTQVTAFVILAPAEGTYTFTVLKKLFTTWTGLGNWKDGEGPELDCYLIEMNAHKHRWLRREDNVWCRPAGEALKKLRVYKS